MSRENNRIGVAAEKIFFEEPLSTSDKLALLSLTPWFILVGEAATNGVDVAITGGTYLIYNYNGTTIYRFISTASDANGYPVEDAFYATLSGGALSGKICQRNT